MERAIEPERRDLPGRKFEVDDFVLRAENVDLADIRDGQYLRADVFDLVAQLAHGSGRRW